MEAKNCFLAQITPHTSNNITKQASFIQNTQITYTT